jgi:dTMP kinase
MGRNGNGLWICLEGGDFTGKRTQISLLFDKLTELDEDNVVVYTHEPTRKAREVKRKLKEERGDAYGNSEEMAELYIADRVSHERDVVNPILKSGGIVISNRHKYSTDAYQSAQGMDLEKLIRLQKKFGVGTPDVTFFLDISTEERIERMKYTGDKGDKFESDLMFQERVAEAYRNIFNIQSTDREYFGVIKIVDGNAIPMHVGNNIWRDLRPVYNDWVQSRGDDFFEKIK